jgi:hypothetical protein
MSEESFGELVSTTLAGLPFGAGSFELELFVFFIFASRRLPH